MIPAAVRLKSGLQRGPEITILVDGRTVQAFAGETVAAALMAAGLWRLRASPRTRAPRGAFCMMGVCQECAIRIDGALAQACLTPVRDGMAVELRGVP